MREAQLRRWLGVTPLGSLLGRRRQKPPALPPPLELDGKAQDAAELVARQMHRGKEHQFRDLRLVVVAATVALREPVLEEFRALRVERQRFEAPLVDEERGRTLERQLHVLASGRRLLQIQSPRLALFEAPRARTRRQRFLILQQRGPVAQNFAGLL